jgi:hypothetical protein
MSSSFPTFQAVLNKQWVKVITKLSMIFSIDSYKQDPTHTVVAISTPNGYTFQMFAKNSESGMYLYENFTEPYYNSGMIWDTWENGANDNKVTRPTHKVTLTHIRCPLIALLDIHTIGLNDYIEELY